MSSPLSKRSKGPSQKETSDNPPEVRSGGQTSPISGDKTAKVPQHKTEGHGNSGVTASSQTVSTSAAAPDLGGRPGFAKSEDAQSKGGTPERFASNRGRNS